MPNCFFFFERMGLQEQDTAFRVPKTVLYFLFSCYRSKFLFSSLFETKCFFAVAVLYAIRFFPTVRSMEYYNTSKRFCPHGIAKTVVFTFSQKEKCHGAADKTRFFVGICQKTPSPKYYNNILPLENTPKNNQTKTQ